VNLYTGDFVTYPIIKVEKRQSPCFGSRDSSPQWNVAKTVAVSLVMFDSLLRRETQSEPKVIG